MLTVMNYRKWIVDNFDWLNARSFARSCNFNEWIESLLNFKHHLSIGRAREDYGLRPIPDKVNEQMASVK